MPVIIEFSRCIGIYSSAKFEIKLRHRNGDRDAVDDAYLICEMFSYYKNRGIGLLEKLNELFDKYGHCLNTLHLYTFEGSAGFVSKKINIVLDYSKGLDGLPKSDVLKYLMEGNCSFDD